MVNGASAEQCRDCRDKRPIITYGRASGFQVRKGKFHLFCDVRLGRHQVPSFVPSRSRLFFSIFLIPHHYTLSSYAFCSAIFFLLKNMNRKRREKKDKRHTKGRKKKKHENRRNITGKRYIWPYRSHSTWNVEPTERLLTTAPRSVRSRRQTAVSSTRAYLPTHYYLAITIQGI